MNGDFPERVRRPPGPTGEALQKTAEACAEPKSFQELVEKLGVRRETAAGYLRLLLYTGVLKRRRVGRKVVYSLHPKGRLCLGCLRLLWDAWQIADELRILKAGCRMRYLDRLAEGLQRYERAQAAAPREVAQNPRWLEEYLSVQRERRRVGFRSRPLPRGRLPIREVERFFETLRNPSRKNRRRLKLVLSFGLMTIWFRELARYLEREGIRISERLRSIMESPFMPPPPSMDLREVIQAIRGCRYRLDTLPPEVLMECFITLYWSLLCYADHPQDFGYLRNVSCHLRRQLVELSKGYLSDENSVCP